ncbi:MAG: (d)CMP kinase [Rhodobacter sp.]|nr:(d)CMP kinase [Rhodobacter sp.]
MDFIVAVDGPAASGKGTISRAIAARFGFTHLDTGLLYRAVARRVIDGEDPVVVARTLRSRDLERSDLRSVQVSRKASHVAADGRVRNALVGFQRDFAHSGGGAVLDGRDIGTVICPDADCKIFVFASDEVRAERRYLELSQRDPSIDLERVLRDIRDRDARDRGRAIAPLRPAENAVPLDTSQLTIEEASACAASIVDKAIRGDARTA